MTLAHYREAYIRHFDHLIAEYYGDQCQDTMARQRRCMKFYHAHYRALLDELVAKEQQEMGL